MNMHRPAFSRAWLFPLLLCGTASAQADVGSDWLTKVTPPPKTLSDAQAQCGENAPHPTSWNKFASQLQALTDKMQKDAQTRMSDPKYQQEMMEKTMAASMDPQAAMAQMQYGQYMAGVAGSSPQATGENLFKPLDDSATATATAALKANNAKIKKCPTVPGGEEGPYPAPFCQKPIDADSAAKKNAAANQYLVAVAKAWSGYTKGAQDYFKKLNVVPEGVDPENMNVKMQRDNIPAQELAAVQSISEQSEKTCNNAVQISQLYVNTDQ